MNPVTPQPDHALAFRLEKLNREAQSMSREELLEALRVVAELAKIERTKADFFRRTWEGNS